MVDSDGVLGDRLDDGDDVDLLDAKLAETGMTAVGSDEAIERFTWPEEK